MKEGLISAFENALISRVPADEVRKWAKESSLPYRELMSYYKCAIMEVETKFRVLSEEFSLGNDNNPIESIKTRLKSPDSIIDKLIRNRYPLNVKSIEENINDIA